MKFLVAFPLLWAGAVASDANTASHQRSSGRSRRLATFQSGSSSLPQHPSRKLKAELTRSKKSGKSPKSRKCKKSTDDEQVELKCSADDGDIKDEIDFGLSVGLQGAVVKVKYTQNDRSNDMDDVTNTRNGIDDVANTENAMGDVTNTRTKEEFTVSFNRLIEYLPHNESTLSLGYDWNQDTIVKTQNLSEWEPFSSITEGEDGLMQFYVETKGGTLRLNFKLSTRESDNLELSVNRIKLDVNITDFDWQQNNTLLALISDVESKTEVSTHYQSSKLHKREPLQPTDVTINFNNSTQPFGEFFWVTQADIGNGTETSEVKATSPEHLGEDTSSQPIAFSFLNSNDASTIYWDPEAGVGYPSDGYAPLGRMRTTGIVVSIAAAVLSLMSM